MGMIHLLPTSKALCSMTKPLILIPQGGREESKPSLAGMGYW